MISGPKDSVTREELDGTMDAETARCCRLDTNRSKGIARANKAAG